jgi:hypothetical protein
VDLRVLDGSVNWEAYAPAKEYVPQESYTPQREYVVGN